MMHIWSVKYLFGHMDISCVTIISVTIVLYALYYHIGFCICLNGHSKACLGVVLAYLETLNYH